jgi:hypothetical protein
MIAGLENVILLEGRGKFTIPNTIEVKVTSARTYKFYCYWFQLYRSIH